MLCDHDHCTGCGVCTNVCPCDAITMQKGEHDFIFPEIDEEKCVKCHLCETVCPALHELDKESNVIKVYAAWNKYADIRKGSTSGGLFTPLAEAILKEGGIVAGVKWDEEFHTRHCIVENLKDLSLLRGSKYVQSETGTVFKQVKSLLDSGKCVLFSGTPCQNNALRTYLKKNYDRLFQVDLVCHGVPSYEMFKRHLSEVSPDNIFPEAINLRYKEKYWDYTYVCINYKDGQTYKELTIDDPYFNLFNIGYSLRECCHNCPYTTTHRYSDITLADFWGYKAHSYKMSDFLKGTSLVLINSDKGEKLFEMIKDKLVCEESNLIVAKSGNKSLSEPFQLDETSKLDFWKDYENGMSVVELNEKYTKGKFTLPKLLRLKRMKKKIEWVWMHE